MMVNPSWKDWSRLLEDALWSHRTAYWTLLGMAPYRIVFVELKDEHTNNTFQVNGHQIKLFHEDLAPTMGDMNTILQMELAPPDDTPKESLKIPSVFMSCIEDNASFKCGGRAKVISAHQESLDLGEPDRLTLRSSSPKEQAAKV
ncbi:hypothetical protein CR513_20705, partial [Mucuna pruriens]